MISIAEALRRILFPSCLDHGVMARRVGQAADELLVETAMLSRDLHDLSLHPDPLGALVHNMQNERTKRQAIDRGMQGNVAGTARNP
jgi:hypothetical protein